MSALLVLAAFTSGKVDSLTAVIDETWKDLLTCGVNVGEHFPWLAPWWWATLVGERFHP